MAAFSSSHPTLPLALALALALAASSAGTLQARTSPPPPGDAAPGKPAPESADPGKAALPDPASPAPAADADGPAVAADYHPYGWHQIKLDTRYLFTRPFHLDGRGWRKVAATLGTAAVLYIDRQAIRNSVQENASASGESFLEKPRIMGKGAFAPSLALISYGASFATRNDREKETAVLLMESMAFSGLAAGVGQFVLSSQRPDQGNAVHFFRWGGHGVSGDAVLAGSVVPVLRNQYLRIHPGDGPGLRAWKGTATGLLYAGAVLTGFQRIYSDKHWAPDAFLGLVSGFTVGQILCDSHARAREERRSRARVTAVPGGIGVAWSF